MSFSKTKSSHKSMGSGLAGGPFSSTPLEEYHPSQSPSLVKIPRGLAIWARLALLLFLGCAGFVVFIPWTQTISVQGRLSSYYPGQRPQEVHSPINGKVLDWRVNEGDLVMQGQVVLELNDINPKFMAPDLTQRLNESRVALKEQREAALKQAELLEQRLQELAPLAKATLSKAKAKISEAGNKIENTKQKIPPALGAQETARLNLERSLQLEAKGLVSRRELELANQKMTEVKAELNAARAALKESQDSRQALIHDYEKIQAEMTQALLDTQAKRASALGKGAKLSKELADLELKRSNALERNKARQVVAPFEGIVIRLSPQGPGEVVKEGDLLFTLVPKNPSPAVEMWVNSIDAPLLRPGNPVRLLFQGIPAIPLPAWPELMAGTYDGKIQVVDQAANTKGRFRLWVMPDTKRRPWPPQQQVRPGTNVRGWVLLNRVPLWYEIWRRFNLFPPDFNTKGVSLIETLLPKAGRPSK